MDKEKLIIGVDPASVGNVGFGVVTKNDRGIYNVRTCCDWPLIGNSFVRRMKFVFEELPFILPKNAESAYIEISTIRGRGNAAFQQGIGALSYIVYGYTYREPVQIYAATVKKFFKAKDKEAVYRGARNYVDKASKFVLDNAWKQGNHNATDAVAIAIAGHELNGEKGQE